MNNKHYTPQPVDVADIELPAELMELAEVISKNVHEVWAQNRINEGWVYGAERNDTLRTTPCLVPYEELSDEEKAYDRETALNTLKHIIALGFNIKKREL